MHWEPPRRGQPLTMGQNSWIHNIVPKCPLLGCSTVQPKGHGSYWLLSTNKEVFILWGTCLDHFSCKTGCCCDVTMTVSQGASTQQKWELFGKHVYDERRVVDSLHSRPIWISVLMSYFVCLSNFLWNISCIPCCIVTPVARGNECFREFEIATDLVTSYTLGRSFVQKTP